MKHAHNFQDLSGMRYGSLTVIEYAGDKRAKWLCRCDCGKSVIVYASHLKDGHTQSCGCLHKSVMADMQRKNNQRFTRLYRIWAGIKNRCNNPVAKAYKNYGQRGIEICNEWLDFEAFYQWAMKNGYNDTLTIERKDVNGNYCPQNCCWIPRKNQARNKRNNRMITIGGTTRCLAEWAEIYHISLSNIYRREKNGFSIETAITTPINKNLSHKHTNRIAA